MSNTTVPISEWCKEIRVALARKEMNLQSVADEIGYSYTTITALISGRIVKDNYLDIAKKINEVLEVNVLPEKPQLPSDEWCGAAKNDRAELNNLVKAIDERRKKVKEVINQPYAEFEKELKEITDLIKKQSAEIDEQVKAFETAEKEEKRAKIMEAYEKAVGNLAEILPFSKVFDQRYLNKTCKLESAIADVQKKIEQVKTDLETIESVCGKYKLNAKDIYVRTLDLSKAMAEEKRLKDLEEKLEAERIQKEKAAEERRKAEEARKAEAERIRKEEEQKEIERQKKAEEERIAAEKAEAEKKQSVPEMSQDIPTEQVTVPEKEENVPTQETEPAVIRLLRHGLFRKRSAELSSSQLELEIS